MPQPYRPSPNLNPFAQPLPGTPAYRICQTEADCAAMAHIAQSLRKTAQAISPFVQNLSCQNHPLAVLDCTPTLLALAEEIEQDDIPSVQNTLDESRHF